MKKEKKKDKFLEEDLELEEMKKTSDLVFKVENLNLHYGEKQALKNQLPYIGLGTVMPPIY